MQKMNFHNRGQSLIGIIIVLIVVGLIGGGLYYYLQKQIPEVPEIPKKPAEEVVTPEEKAITPPEEELPKEEVILPKPLPKASLKEPQAEITARPAEISKKNSPLSVFFSVMPVFAQEFKTGKELQVEVLDAPPKEIRYPETLTWTVTYGIKNTTDSSFVLTYDLKPDVYKTGGAVVVDPDGNGPKKSFYYTFGEEVLLQPGSEQYLYLSLTPPKGLTAITPRIVFKGFSTEEPLFTHEFSVKVVYIPPPTECETPTCLEGTILYWNGGVDDYKCPLLQCVSPESKPIAEPCESITTTAEGQTIVEKCENCAIISPKGVCAESTTMQCTWKLPPEGWTMVNKCP